MKKRFGALLLAFVMILTLIPPVDTFAAPTTGELMFRWADWSENVPIENLDWDLNTEFNDSPGFTRNVFFYFKDSTGTTRVQAGELTSANNSIVRLSQNTQNGDATAIELIGFGQTTISYEKNGVTYSIDVNIDLPIAGLYTTSTASQNAYIREFTVTDTLDTFYLVTTDDWTIDDVTLQGNFASIANYTIDGSKQFAKIQVTGTPDANNHWYDISYILSNSKYDQSNWQNNTGIQIKNGKPALSWCYPEWNGNSHSKPQNPIWNTSLTSTPGGSNFYFSYVANGVDTPLQASDLVSSNPDVVKISQSSDNADMVWIECLNFGNATITYNDAATGKTYEVPLTVTLPMLGYYNSSIPSTASYISEFEVTDRKDTIYFIARDGWKFDNIYLNNEFDAIADLALDGSKTVATIKITGNPRNAGWYGKYRVWGFYLYSTWFCV